MRLLLAIAAIAVSLSAHADSALHLSHLQHIYAGGGGCAERFWLHWDDLDSDITEIEVLIEVSAKGQRSMTATLRLERLGTTAIDDKNEASVETPQCLSGKPRLTIRAASGVVHGKRIDLLRSGMLRIDKPATYPVRIIDTREAGSPSFAPALRPSFHGMKHQDSASH